MCIRDRSHSSQQLYSLKLFDIFIHLQSFFYNISYIFVIYIFKFYSSRSVSYTHLDVYKRQEVTFLANSGIINGRSETEFAPNDDITREEAAVILTNTAEFMGVKAVSYTHLLK